MVSHPAIIVMKQLFLTLFMIMLTCTVHGESCTNCHKEQFAFSRFHGPNVVSCEQCHGGNPEAVHKETAHLGLEAYPGRMKTLNKSCGQSQCHEELVPLVENSIMNTLDGMLTVTREIYEDQNPPHHNRTVAERLANKRSDQYLRKLCVSCHLGSERKNHQQSFKDRGGGCSACHLQTYATKEVPPGLDNNPNITGVGKIHPTLTIRISSDRCFGCHSRSGRISLNYLGLAETEKIDETRIKEFGYLYDNRLVEQKAADLHHTAGMSCIDCHTGTGLMGKGKRVNFLREQNDIRCNDCHAPKTPSRPVNSLTPRERKYFSLYKDKIEITAADELLVSERFGSPLYHVIQRENKRVMLTKLTGKQLEIPLTSEQYYHTISGHERLTCDSCHTAWAPQCYGCHVDYQADKTQFDHIQRKRTPGRWVETRWHVKSESPALGVVEGEKITTFVPGMNMIVKGSSQTTPMTKQIFAATSAHTTQKKGRSCTSCHQSDEALGIITDWAAHPEHPEWKTPVGWISGNQKKPGIGTKPGDRSFNKQEIFRIKQVGQCLECHKEQDGIYQNWDASIKNLTPACQLPEMR
jgi:hypothetical protein